MDLWENYSLKDVLNIGKSFYYFLKCYFLSKGFKDYDGSFIQNNDKSKSFNISCHGSNIGINFINHIKINNKIVSEQIYLHQFILYPDIIDSFLLVAVSVPNPSWGYGFIEKTIQSLDEYLVEDIYNRKGVYLELLQKSNDMLEKRRKEPHSPITGDMLAVDKENMLKLKFEPKLLSLKLYKERKNPYKDIEKIRGVIV
jgi:hypothetical protein